MQVFDLEVIEKELSIFYQVAKIIIGFILFTGLVFYLGTLDTKRLYKPRPYEFKILILVMGTFYAVFLLSLIIVIYLFYVKPEHKLVYSLSYINYVLLLAIWALYVGLLFTKGKFNKYGVIKGIIYFIVTLIFLLFYEFYLNQPVMQSFISLILLTGFFYYVYRNGIHAGKKLNDSLSKVIVITTYGREENLKLYQTTNADYRFIRNKGEDNEEEIIIPIDKVIKIIAKKVEK